jgi:microcystin degradation protein MlrC
MYGPSIPVACTLDIHTSLTPAMLEGADGLFGSNVYPEIDSYYRGREALGFVTAMVRGRLKPVKAHRYVPLMAQWDGQYTGEGPAKALVDLCREWELEPRMVDCGFFFGYSASDVPSQGTHVVAVTDADTDLAERAAASVADEIWRRRAELVHIPAPPEEAVAMAVAHAGHPVIIAEGSDNPGGGHYGDATSLLAVMLARADEIRPAAFAAIRDPETVAAAWLAGVGGGFDARLGGKSPDAHSGPIEARARVKQLTDGRYTMTFPRFRGTTSTLGRTALLDVGGIDLVVCEESRQIFDSGPFLLHGIDPASQRVVGLKSSVHFRAHYKDFASRIILTVTPSRTKAYPFSRLRQPLWRPEAAG